MSFKRLLHVSFYCGDLCVSLAAILFITFSEPVNDQSFQGLSSQAYVILQIKKMKLKS